MASAPERGPRPEARAARPSRRDGLITLRRALGDVTAILLAFWIAWILDPRLEWLGVPGGPANGPGTMMAAAFGFAVIAIPVFWWSGLYRPRASVLNLWELSTAARAVLISSGWSLMPAWLGLYAARPRGLLLAVPVTLFCVLGERRLVAGILRRLQLRGRMGRRVLIYGVSATGHQVMKKLVESPHMGRTVVGLIDDRAPIGTSVGCRADQSTLSTFRAHVLGRCEDLAAIVKRHAIDELLIDERSVSARRLGDLLTEADRLGLDVGVVPRLGEVSLNRLDLEDLSTIPLLRARRPRDRRLYSLAKRLLDVIIASALLALTAPLWILIPLAIRIGSRGPILFRQTRIGQGGRPFRILKFRTMWSDVDAYASSPVGDSADARITRVGRLLRFSGLDELPQLINVLRGEMSLVGPRPEMPFIVSGYPELERGRLRVPPGITGVWQLSPDRHDQIHESIEYDLYYVQHRALALDLLLLMETVFHTLGSTLSRLFASLPRRRRASLADAVAAVLRPVRAPAVAALLRPGRAPAVTAEVGRVRPEPDGHLLVVLDQRGALDRDDLPPLIRAAHSVSCRWPITVAAAEPYRWALHLLFEEVARREGRGAHWARVVVAWEPGLMAELARSATLVWTDLEAVAEWVRPTGVDILLTGAGEPRLEASTPEGRRIAAELLRWIPPRAGEARTPASTATPGQGSSPAPDGEARPPTAHERTKGCPSSESSSPAPAASSGTISSRI